MLISDQMVFIELRKSGSNKVQKLLADTVGGETSGKHATYAAELTALGKPVVGGVCNPLAWYLDLWRQGCAGKGDLFKRLTEPNRWSLLEAKRAGRVKPGEEPPAKQAMPEGWSAERAKTVWYGSDSDPAAFREWLQAVLATPATRRLVDQRYSSSPLHRLGGLMTYEFVLTFVDDAENMDRSVDSLPALAALFEQKAITRHFLRSESLGEDLAKVMQALGSPLTDAKRQSLDAANRSGLLEADVSKFYDADSRKLVKRREKFINEMFGYSKAGGAEGDGAPAGGEPKPAKAGKAGKAGKVAEADKGAAKANKANKAARAEGDKPALSKAEKQQKKAARTERLAAKEAAGGQAAATGSAAPGGSPAEGATAPASSPEARADARADREKVKQARQVKQAGSRGAAAKKAKAQPGAKGGKAGKGGKPDTSPEGAAAADDDADAPV